MAQAQKRAPFKFEMIQTDNGPEFTKWCTHGWERLGIKHRHGRVRKSKFNNIKRRSPTSCEVVRTSSWSFTGLYVIQPWKLNFVHEIHDISLVPLTLLVVDFSDKYRVGREGGQD